MPPYTRQVLVAVFVVGATLLACSARAQQPDSTDEAARELLPLEEVIVTGTRITKRDFQSPSPVYTLSGDAIQMQGFPTLEQVLNRLPQFSPSFGRTRPSSTEDGALEASVNLRGLGANRNLVLLDGGRLGASGSHGVVNVNTLPSIMVERVEVLTGGASSVYGSDAMSGVVNFITRKDFEGFELTGSYEMSDESDADAGSINAAGGFNFAGGRGNVSGFIDYYKRDRLFGDQRDFSADRMIDDAQAASFGWLEDDPVGVFIPAGNYFTPEGITFTYTDDIIFDEDGNPRILQPPEDTFTEWYTYLVLQSPLERTTGRLLVNYEFSDRLKGHVDLLASHNEDSLAAPPTQGLSWLEVNLDNPVLTPATRQLFEDYWFNPNTGTAFVPFLRRFTELGAHSRTHDWESDNWRLNLGLEGVIFTDWRWQADYYQSEQDYDYSFKGAISRSRLQQAMLVDPVSGQCYDPSNGCAPADVFGPGRLSSEAVDFLSAPPGTADSSMTLQQLNLFMEGQVDTGLLPELSLGAGLEYRREDGDFDSDEALEDVDLMGFDPINTVDGDYDMVEAFVELFLPLVRDRPYAHEISLEAGLRYSNHSEIGDYWTWKSGASWAPSESLRLRAMFQRAVRAPNLEEMFRTFQELTFPAGPFPEDVHDPCSAINDPVGNGYTDLCVAQGIPEGEVGTWQADPLYLRDYRIDGNTDLDTESADTWTVGFVWQPDAINGLSLAADWYRIEIDDAIQWIESGASINFCFESGNNNSDYCQGFDRADDGNIAWELSTFRNLARLKAEGVDLQAEFTTDAPGEMPGYFRLAFLGNWNRETSGQSHSFAEEYDCTGLFGGPCNVTGALSFPEFRTTSTLGYDLGNFSAQLLWHWIDEIENAWNDYPPDWLEPGWPLAADKVDSMNYFDLNASWQATDNMRLTAGITNLTDEEPPRYGSQSGWVGTDSSLYDTLGRRFHLSMTWRF